MAPEAVAFAPDCSADVKRPPWSIRTSSAAAPTRAKLLCNSPNTFANRIFRRGISKCCVNVVVFITHLHFSEWSMPASCTPPEPPRANPEELTVFKLFIASLEPKWARRTGRNQNGAASGLGEQVPPRWPGYNERNTVLTKCTKRIL